MEYTFTTSRGVTVRVLPMSGELDRLTALKTTPRFRVPVPTYSKTTAGKVVQTFEHNETTLEVEGDAEQTSQNKLAWNKYLKAQADADEQYGTIFARSIISNGIAVDAEAHTRWLAKREFIDPADPVLQAESLEQHYQWVMDEVLGEPKDMNGIIVKVIEASGAPEEVVRAAEDSFLGGMGGRENDSGTTDLKAHGGAMLEVQPKIRGRKRRVRKARHSA